MKTNRISNKVKLLVLGVLSILMLAACGKQPPKDVSKEVWEDLIQNTLYIIKTTNDGEMVDVNLVLNENPQTLTEAELKTYQKVLQLGADSLKIIAYDSRIEYDESYKEVIKTFGKSNLKMSNFDEEEFQLNATSKEVAKHTKYNEIKEEYMKDKEVKLEGKDVQYDMANNLGKDFYLYGTVELCDYYNYGYKDERKYFCGKYTSSELGYNETWYIYFEREGFKKLYNHLLSGSVTDIMTIANIPGGLYKEGQGNMALAKSSSQIK